MKAIIVLYDSLNKRSLPCYNPDCGVLAPNFERLACHTATFDNCYVGSMPCIPARRELHTGRYNFLHREWGPLEPYDDSMIEQLGANGVYTHLISDHLHYWEDGGSNYHTRYKSWEAVRGQEGDHWKGEVGEPPIPPALKIPGKHEGKGSSALWRYDWVNRQYICKEKQFPQTQVFDLGCQFLDKNHDQDNWLLQIETFDPHEPFYLPEEYRELYPTGYQGKHYDWTRGQKDELDTPEAVAHARAQYQALVTMCDKNLGRVLDMMDRHDMWKDTMLLVGTDHGILLAEHGWWSKNLMPYYNEIANTPFFAWDPRSGVQGQHRQSLVQLIDWAPTLLDYFGQPIPPDMQGHPLAQTVAEDAPVRQYALYGAFSAHVNITDGRHVYMRAPVPEQAGQIYNYTLMPAHMNKRFTPDELHDATLEPPQPFTKGCPLMKIRCKGGDRYHVAGFGNLLYDVKNDPQQQHPLTDAVLEQKLAEAMVGEMEKNDAPAEQYIRLGLR